MRSIVLIITILIIRSDTHAQTRLIFDEPWFFSEADNNQWLTCTIPGNCYSALLENKKIPDPYFSDNETKLQSVSKKDWWFKTSIEIDSGFLSNEHIQLHCPGLDTYCSIFLNGYFIGRTDNAFRNWNFDVKNKLRIGPNDLLFKFQSAEEISNSLYSKLKTSLPGEARVVSRKPQFHFGWDFGPRFISSGITAPVYLHGWNSITCQEASVHTLALVDSFADLKLNARLFITDTQSNYKLKLILGEHEFTFPIQSRYGMQTIHRFFTLKHPKLWWPNGMGNPNLYSTTLRIFKNEEILFEKKWKTGIRTIELKNKQDAEGQSFYFQVNGKPVFCKGANYIPQDILGLKKSNHQQIIQTAVESNFNMLRIWGGGQYEDETFYNACDEAGIMIWQDFMYACAMYPGDSVFLKNARIEAEEQVERLSKHACISLWCGNNEINEGWHRWGWQDAYSSKERRQIWNDYLNLFEIILPKAVDLFSNKNNYWASSPLYGRGDERFMRNGDAHDWGLWHDEMPFEKLETRVPRFMSEFGFQSWPSMETIKQFATETALNPESKTLSNHQKHSRGNKIINQYLERDYPKPDRFESLVYLNQIMQAEGIGKIINAHRLARPYCMGSLYWQFNDCWPGISWSGLDYFGRWKALQHKVKQSFEPVTLIAKHDDESIRVFAVSDVLQQEKGSFDISLQDFSGKTLFVDHWEGLIPLNSVTEIYFTHIPLKNLNIDDTHYILLKWIVDDQQRSQAFFLDKFKNLKLKNPGIDIIQIVKTEKGFRMELTCTVFAKSVYLSNQQDAFFPNYFDMNPNETIVVDCISNDSVFDKEKLRIQSLFDFLK